MWASFQRARVMDQWTTVPCVILESRLTEEILTPNTPVNYRPLIRYRYDIKSQSYESDRIRRIETKSSRRPKMQAILAQFPPGTETMAWVNPAKASAFP